MRWALIVDSLRGVWKALMRLPVLVRCLLLTAILSGAGMWQHTRWVQRAIVADRAEQKKLADRQLDSLRLELKYSKRDLAASVATTQAAWAARDSAIARTRTTERALQAAQHRLAGALVTLPDSLRPIPQVAGVVDACNALAHDCEQLRADIIAERAAADTAKAAAAREAKAREVIAATADTALRAAAQVIQAERRQNHTLRGRVSKRLAIAGYVIARVGEWLVTDAVRRRQP